MGVDQARQDGAVVHIDDVRSVRNYDVRFATDSGDTLSLDDDNTVLDGLRSSAVDDGAVAKHEGRFTSRRFSSRRPVRAAAGHYCQQYGE